MKAEGGLKQKRNKRKPKGRSTPQPIVEAPETPTWVVTLGLLFFTVCTVYAGSTMISSGARERRARGWPSVPGVVTEWKVERSRDDGKDYFTPFPSYIYAVDGQAYRGSSAYPSQDGLADFASWKSSGGAYGSLRRFPIGKPIQVYYDPERPWDAVLDPTGSSGFWPVLEGIGMLLVFIVGAGSCWMSLVGRSFRVGPLLLALGLTVASTLSLRTSYSGNADEIPGGVLKLEDEIAKGTALRDLWRTRLRPNAEIGVSEIPVGGSKTVKTTPNGRLWRYTYKQGGGFERSGTLTLWVLDDKKARVAQVQSPYYP